MSIFGYFTLCCLRADYYTIVRPNLSPGTVIINKRITVPDLVRYGSRSITKKRAVKTKGSVRFTPLLTVRIKNGTLTGAIAVKNVTVKKNGKRYGQGSGDKSGRTIVFEMYIMFATQFRL